MNTYDYINELSQEYRCEYCLAGRGVWCRTRSGAVATHLHSQRSDPVRLALVRGREDGYAEGKLQVQSSGSVSALPYKATWTG